MVSPNDKYRSIAPGQTIEFEFTPNYPGVYMYHCGTPMVLEHIASGMYGMMIVEPRGGYPTKVDHEYAVVQSEFYTKLDVFDGPTFMTNKRTRSPGLAASGLSTMPL
jgi:nitrite reductase (NO-forming)